MGYLILGGIIICFEGGGRSRIVLQCVLVQPLRMIIADGLTQARIHFQILMQWVRRRKVAALTFVSQQSWG